MIYETSIPLDLSGEQFSRPATAKQGDQDSRYITAQLSAYGVPYQIPEGTVARVALRKPNGEHVLNDATITGESGIRIPLTQQMLTHAGTARAEVMLFSGEAMLSSAVFDLEILPAAYHRQTVESAPEYQSFVNALNGIQGITVEVERVTAEAAEQAAYAQQQGGYAQTQGDAAKTQAQAAQTAAQAANDAAEEANEAAPAANSAADRANTAAEQCQGIVEDVTGAVAGIIEEEKGIPLGLAGLDENGTLDIDVLPIGTTWTWWGDTLPSEKWAFGNTAIPASCTAARAIWGARTPNTPGRVLVDKSAADVEFNAVSKTCGEKTHTLTTEEMPSHMHSAYFHHDEAPAGSITGGFPIGREASRNWDIPSDPTGGDDPHNNIQPSIVCRYLYKIK